jgi:hypothetical protein
MMANPQHPTKPSQSTKNDPHGDAADTHAKAQPPQQAHPTTQEVQQQHDAKTKAAGQQRDTDAAREAAQNKPTPLTKTREAGTATFAILPGFEGDEYETVTLFGSGPGDGTYRVGKPLPQSVVSNGGRYMRSTPDSYAWQVP